MAEGLEKVGGPGRTVGSFVFNMLYMFKVAILNAFSFSSDICVFWKLISTDRLSLIPIHIFLFYTCLEVCMPVLVNS